MAYAGQRLTIRITLDDEVRVYDEERLVASHRLVAQQAGWVTVPEHHAALWQETLQVEQRPLDIYEKMIDGEVASWS